jgi:hypothetical protein
MIVFRRGVVVGAAGADLEIDLGGETLVAEMPVPLGSVPAGGAVLVARTKIDVGTARHELTMAIGAWPMDAPDPAGPLGLASTPVIVLPDPVWSDLAIAGALRAGRQPACLRLPGDAPALGLQMLVAVTEGADVILVEGGAGPHLLVARALGGRPLPVLPLPDRDAIAAMFRGCDLDVHVPVPALEDPQRAEVSAVLRGLALETTHHVVEVDPAPAFAQAGLAIGAASLEALAAGAAGVLAGRLAAGNRRWRAQLQP